MKATGIVRRIDELGRVVIPKEIRKVFRLREGDPLEIFTSREGELIFKKYSPINEIGEFAEEYANKLNELSGNLTLVTDTDSVIACAGEGRKAYLGGRISESVMSALEKRKTLLLADGKDRCIPLTETDDKEYARQAVVPILVDGDVLGGVVFASEKKEEDFLNDVRFLELAAYCLGANFS